MVQIHADGTRESSYEVLENGRGPKTTSKLKLAPDRTLASFDATGHDTMGLPIDEHFSIDAGRARWKSTSESGEQQVQQPAYYLPLAAEPDSLGLLAEALLAAGGTLALLPAGQARAERAGDATVRSSSGVSRHLTAWGVTGLWFTPVYAWMDDSGRFFGVASTYYSMVPEGWESAVEPLIQQGKKLDQARARELASRLAHRPPAAGVAIRGARVLDLAAKRWLPDQTVLIEGARIKSIGPSKTTRTPEGAELIEAGGKALIPGLWDMHAHLGPSDGAMYIASGVTTARDMGNDPDVLDDMKKQFDDASAVGPHVLRAGFIEGRGEKAAGSKVTAETEAEARVAVDEFARRGYEQMKIYNSMKPELVPVIASAAHDHGMRVSGHVPVHMRAEQAVRAGFDELNHINMVFLNFFIDESTDTRTTLRFSIPAEKGAGLDLASRPVTDFIALLRQKKTVVDPTVHVFEALLTARPGAVAPNAASIASRLPATLQRELRTGGIPVPDGKDQLYKDSFAAMLRMIKLLYDSKVPLVAGTDQYGLMLARELELYVQAGIPAGDVLEIATLGAARVMRKDKTTGSIAVGKDADLVLIDGDPLKAIGDVRNVAMVMRSGIRYEPGPLWTSVGVKP